MTVATGTMNQTGGMKTIKVVYNSGSPLGRPSDFNLSQKALARMLELGYSDVVRYKELPEYEEQLTPCEGFFRGCLEREADDYVLTKEPLRHDPILVQVVEELGSEASGGDTRLSIDDVDCPYFIESDTYREFIVKMNSFDWIIPGQTCDRQ